MLIADFLIVSSMYSASLSSLISKAPPELYSPSTIHWAILPYTEQAHMIY